MIDRDGWCAPRSDVQDSSDYAAFSSGFAAGEAAVRSAVKGDKWHLGAREQRERERVCVCVKLTPNTKIWELCECYERDYKNSPPTPLSPLRGEKQNPPCAEGIERVEQA